MMHPDMSLRTVVEDQKRHDADASPREGERRVPQEGRGRGPPPGGHRRTAKGASGADVRGTAGGQRCQQSRVRLQRPNSIHQAHIQG